MSPLENVFVREVGKRQQRRHLSNNHPPVVVVGNIAVGGTGKTPVVVALAEWFLAQGLTPGIISRGYGGSAPAYPLVVEHETPVAHCGDEAKLLLGNQRCPVVVDPERVRAYEWLSENHSVDVVISDDGLQHYALPRAFEIAVVDGKRLLGNGHCLPVGPLREPAERLQQVDAILQNGGETVLAGFNPVYRFELVPQAWVNVKTGERKSLDAFDNSQNYRAVAGIGNPQRFFDTLSRLDIAHLATIFPDHYAYSEQDFTAFFDQPLLMTEKDAVKCVGFARPDWWYLQVGADLPVSFWSIMDRFVQRHMRA